MHSRRFRFRKRLSESDRSLDLGRRKGGRPKKLDDRKRQQAKALLKDPAISISEICRTLKVGRSTLYRYAAEKDAT